MPSFKSINQLKYGQIIGLKDGSTLNVEKLGFLTDTIVEGIQFLEEEKKIREIFVLF